MRRAVYKYQPPVVAEPERLRIWQRISVISMLTALSFTAMSWYLFSYAERATPLAVAVAAITLALGSYAASAALRRSRIPRWPRRILFFFLVLAGLYGSYKLLLLPSVPIGFFDLLARPVQSFSFLTIDQAEIWHFLIWVFLIWAATLYAVVPVDIDRSLAVFQLNIFIFILYTFSTLGTASLQPLLLFFGFLFFSLVSLSTARIASVGLEKGGRLPKLSALWLAGIPAAALIFVLLALTGGWVSANALSPAFRVIVMVLLGLAILIIGILTIPIIMLISALVPGFMDLIRQFFKNVIDNSQITALQQSISSGSVTENLFNFINSGTAMGLGLLLVLLVALTVFNLQRKGRADSALAEDSELALRFASNLVPALSMPRPPRNSPAFLNWLAAEKIRRIYIQLLELCFRLDLQREDAWTPQEYMVQMYSIFPDQVENLKRVTHAYEKVRYGKLHESSGEIAEVEAAWESVNAAGSRLLAARKKLNREIQYH